MSKVKISAELAHALETLIDWDCSGDNRTVLMSIRLMKESEFEYTSQELKILNETNLDVIEAAILNGYEVIYDLNEIKAVWKRKEEGIKPVDYINKRKYYQKLKKEVDFLKTLGYDELEVINCKKEGIEWKLQEIEVLNKVSLKELEILISKKNKDESIIEEELNLDDLLDLYNLAGSIGQAEWQKEILENLNNL